MMKREKWIGEGVLNFYLRRPLLYDLCIALAVFLLVQRFGAGLTPRQNQENNILYLISVDASLSGFVIAALTILVTVKANTQYKAVDEMKEGVDFLFNTPLYKTLIKVFLLCIVEFVLIAFALFLLNFYYTDQVSATVASLFIAALLMSFLAAVRTIGILASAVMIQANSK